MIIRVLFLKARQHRADPFTMQCMRLRRRRVLCRYNLYYNP